MTTEEIILRQISGNIAAIGGGQAEAILELADHIRRAVEVAGRPVGYYAVALVNAEMNLSMVKNREIK